MNGKLNMFSRSRAASKTQERYYVRVMPGTENSLVLEYSQGE